MRTPRDRRSASITARRSLAAMTVRSAIASAADVPTPLAAAFAAAAVAAPGPAGDQAAAEGAGPATGAAPAAGRSNPVRVSPGLRIIARSTTLRSSRALPGQRYDFKSDAALSVSAGARRPRRTAMSRAKWRARSGMSSTRSRRGGRSMRMTFRR